MAFLRELLDQFTQCNGTGVQAGQIKRKRSRCYELEFTLGFAA